MSMIFHFGLIWKTLSAFLMAFHFPRPLLIDIKDICQFTRFKGLLLPFPPKISVMILLRGNNRHAKCVDISHRE